MKFYSEVLKKLFDTKDALDEAERIAKEAEEKKAEQKALISKEKKACADIVKASEDNVSKAQEEFNAVRKESQEIINKAYEEARRNLREASKKLSTAQEERYKALKDFNEKYGPYTTSYTGEKAYNEFKKELDKFNSFFNFDSIFDFIF